MAKDRFMIAPYNTGWRNDLNPWLLPREAFSDLRNAFVYEGRIRKRAGGSVLNCAATDPELNTRLRINIGTTNGGGTLAGVVPGAIFEVGQAFSVGSEVFTVNVLGVPGVMLTTGAATTHTYNTTTGAYDIQGAAGTTAVYFYPAQPVMGFSDYEQAEINDEATIGFDTQFAYQWVNTEWMRLATGNDVWTGGNADFFWGTTWRGATAEISLFYATNFVIADRIRYWNGVTWAILDPIYGTGGNDHVVTAKIVVPFKDRLLLFNTIEVTGTNTAFVNRLRYSQNGSPLDAQGWRQDIPGRGGFLDAPTKEAVISVEFIKDRLIVYFERSTYELAYTANEVLPFKWQKINTELGAESSFSIIPFDKAVLGVGNTGIHACNGINVERIDENIKSEVFDINNENNGHIRVQGIRDYFFELVYWTYPSVSQKDGASNNTFPNRMLVYDYIGKSWAYNDDSITALGYLQKTVSLTWAAAKIPWQEATFSWDDSSNNALFRSVLAGNQEGYTFIVDPNAPRNSPALQITDIALSLGGFIVTVTAINHNLAIGDYVMIENVTGTTGINDRIYRVNITTSTTFTIVDDQSTVTGTYTGGGTIAKVTTPDMMTKRYNFYIKEGRNIHIEKVDFLVDRTASGECTIDYFTTSSAESLFSDGTFATQSILGDSVLQTTPYDLHASEQTMDRFWHPVYLQADGQFIQLRIFLFDTQIRTPAIAHSEFVINGMIFYATPTADRPT